jgi:formylglycine-generating enzyme required for sulfatase activity
VDAAGGTWTFDAEQSAAPGVAEAGSALTERYEDLGVIGRGGMGVVHRVWDRLLDRPVAMKVLRPGALLSAGAVERFRREASITARMQHPGIVAVHDRGAFDDGRLWFTMEEVRGDTFARAIEALHAGRAGDPEVFTGLRRLVAALARVAEALAYAHSRGVVHRDVKPSNLMLGAFGAVLVMDWGVATSAEAPGPEGVVGSPAWMAPEQAGGAPALPASDVYALGAVLYELLGGRAPYSGAAGVVLRRLLVEPPAPLAGLVEQAPFRVDPALVALCERAMARELGQRTPDAASFARSLLDWLDGVAARERAMAIVAEAALLRPQIAALRSEADALRQRAAVALEGVPSFAPVEAKREGWALIDRSQALLRQAEVDETRYAQTLRSALYADPELEAALSALAELHVELLARAEAAHDEVGAATHALMVAAYDRRGRYERWLAGEGTYLLRTAPAGLPVSLWRERLVDRYPVLEPVRELGCTPVDVQLPRGSWRLRLELAPERWVELPVALERLERSDGAPPGAREGWSLPVPSAAELAEDVWVPAGWFRAGGDGEAMDALPARRVWVEGFLMQRRPVTVAEYLAFLDDLVARGEHEAAARHAPCEAGTTESPRALVRLDAHGRHSLVPDAQGVRWQEHWPVTMVDWFGASAYAAWWAARTGQPWRLPHDHEWEKAARGVDGRAFPWGDGFDPTWACSAGTHAHEPGRASVHQFPQDRSPYGVLGLGGNVRDWCANGYAREGPTVREGRLDVGALELASPYRMTRGGAWASRETHCRSAVRFADRPSTRLSVLGFRLVRSWPG